MEGKDTSLSYEDCAFYEIILQKLFNMAAARAQPSIAWFDDVLNNEHRTHDTRGRARNRSEAFIIWLVQSCTYRDVCSNKNNINALSKAANICSEWQHGK